MTVLAAMFAASGGFAATCADPIVNGTGANAAKIAVASNFYGPAQDLVKNYFHLSPYGANTAVTVCHDSTGNLKTAISSGNADGYAMFFAADNTTIPALEMGKDFVYARGVPVLFTNSVSNVTDLIPTAPALVGGVSTISNVLTPVDALNTGTAQPVAIANPTTAPYGNSACKILNDMGLISSVCPTLPATLPAWLSQPYSNIDNTYNAVTPNTPTATNTSGFAAKSQVCQNLGTGTLKVIEFTNSQYATEQTALLIKTENAGARALNAYIHSTLFTGEWNEFLADNCYNIP
jgi:molybdate transport system substrate-binding protein